MHEELLAKAKEYIEEPDAIMDLYDMTVIYLSESHAKFLGYSWEEIIGKQVDGFLGSSKGDDEKAVKQNMLADSGVHEISVKTKEGKIYIQKIGFKNFEYEGGYYMVAKILEYKPKE